VLRLLAVGLGVSGRFWIRRALPRVPEVELAGCVDLDPVSLERVQEEAGVPASQCFTSLSDALATTGPEAVLVATPLPGHVPVARVALEGGRHVLLEKPFAPGLPAARELVDLAARCGLALMVNQNYRYYPAARAAAALVRSRELGDLRAVEVDFRHGPTAPLGLGHRVMEHPMLLDMAVHHFDLLRLLVGREPDEVSCHAWNPPGSGFAGPPAAVTTIRFGAGLLASHRGTWLGAGRDTAWAGEWRLLFEGGEAWWTGRASMTSGDGDRLVVTRDGAEPEEVALPDLPAVDRAGVLREFVAAVRAGREPECSGRDNLGTLGLSLAAIESAVRGGAPVTPAR
jgi:predicted dehydrogenase